MLGATRAFHGTTRVSLFSKVPKTKKDGHTTSTSPTPAAVNSTGAPAAATTRSGISVAEEQAMNSHPILKRVPQFLRPFASRFIHAPISHVTAFLILHELTAIIPLIGVWYALHKFNLTIPMDLPSWAIDKGTKVIDSSMSRFDFTGWNVNEKFTFIMQGAYAFVIVKFLLPVRIMLSLGLMPWFSKWVVVPFTRIFRRKPKTPPSEVKETVKKIEKPRL